MHGIFSYDSKLVQTLLPIGDIIILNLLYLVCCIPIFTIGAAQAGLYSGVRMLLDKENDSSVAKAFFRGFVGGFGKITLAWLIFGVLIALSGWSLVLVLVYHYAGANAPVPMAIAALCICALFQSLLPLFHSRFECKALQLIRNAWFLFIAHPLRSIAVTVLTWAPVALFLWNTYLFMNLTPILLCCYYSVAFMLGFLVMKKPFQTLIDHFNESHSEEEETPENEENEELQTL